MNHAHVLQTVSVPSMSVPKDFGRARSFKFPTVTSLFPERKKETPLRERIVYGDGDGKKTKLSRELFHSDIL